MSTADYFELVWVPGAGQFVLRPLFDVLDLTEGDHAAVQLGDLTKLGLRLDGVNASPRADLLRLCTRCGHGELAHTATVIPGEFNCVHGCTCAGYKPKADVGD